MIIGSYMFILYESGKAFPRIAVPFYIPTKKKKEKNSMSYPNLVLSSGSAACLPHALKQVTYSL